MIFNLEIRCNDDECENYDNAFNGLSAKCDMETIVNIIKNWGTPSCDEDYCPVCDNLGKVSIVGVVVDENQDDSNSKCKLDDDTWTKLSDVGEQLQNIMNDGLATKNEIMKFLDNEIAKPSWYHYGRDIASGEEGTKQMKVVSDDLCRYREMDHDDIVKNVEHLTETDQWNSEVCTLIKKYNVRDDEGFVDDKDEWVDGYVSFIIDALKKKE